MHTDSSLEVLDIITIAFGQKLRDFAEETCKNFDTVETDREYQTWKRAEARRESCGGGDGDEESGTSSGKRRRAFNLMTPKLHFLGDYVAQIRALGTTDSFTSQIVSINYLQVAHWLTKNVRANFNIELSRHGMNAQARTMLSRKLSTWMCERVPTEE